MKQLTVILFTCLAALVANGQDLHFSQFYDMPLLRNPALSGIFNGQYEASAIYRNQWNNITVPFQTMALGAEYKAIGVSLSDPFSLTFGLQVLRDQAGSANLTRTMYAPNISGRISLDNGMYVSTGFLAGPVTSTFNPNNLTWGDEYVNGTFTGVTGQPISVTGRNYFDLGAGAVVGRSDPEYTQWYLGLAAYHVNNPRVGFGAGDRLPVRTTFNAGLGLKLADDQRIFFYGDAIVQASQYEYLLGGMYTKYFVDGDDENEEGISFGAFYRWNDALVPTVKLQFSQWALGFSYDFTISRLQPGSQAWGGPELMLKFKGFPATGKGINCPRGGL